MDIEAFKDENFNAIDWINSCYEESSTSEENKETFVSNLVSKLQLYVQNVNATLEDTSQQVISSMPKIMKDVQHLQTEAKLFQTKMSEVQNEISQVQRETGSCMSNLERLDTLKTKLQTAKQGLQESDGWGRLTGELEDLLDQNDIGNACEKIFVLQKSLAAQAGLPGQSEREVQVEDARNKLEASASPNVVKAFSSGDIEQSKKFVEMFNKINRLSQLKQYYRTVQKSNLSRQWTEIVELSENSNSNRFLKEFYEILLEHWQKQMKWCNQVFGDQKSFPEPNQVLIELLNALEPTREAAISHALKRNVDKLEVLRECSSANSFFGTQMQIQFSNLEVNSPKEHQVALSRAIFDYFNPYIQQYAAIEQNWLAQQLVLLNLNQTNPAESIRVLGNSNSKVLQFIQEAMKRCENITRNCAVCPMIIVINSFFREYLDKYKKAQKQLEATRTTEESWNLIQTCTTLLQHIGDLMLILTDLQESLIPTLNETFANVCRQELSAFQYKVLKKQDVNELKKTVNAIKEDPNEEFPLFKVLIQETINPICSSIHDTTLISIFQPIEIHLKNIQPEDNSINHSGEDLPDYSFAPQEYITQIGQYLMTLPQHLEPLLLSPSKALKLALEHSDEKYAKDASNSGDVFLSMIADETCALFVDNVVQIPELSNYSSKQLATDIEYLGSVLEELGLTLSKTLQQMVILLKTSQDNYHNVSAGCEPKLVMTIRQKRNLTLCD